MKVAESFNALCEYCTCGEYPEGNTDSEVCACSELSRESCSFQSCYITKGVGGYQANACRHCIRINGLTVIDSWTGEELELPEED